MPGLQAATRRTLPGGGSVTNHKTPMTDFDFDSTRYAKRPVVIHAFQWKGNNAGQVRKWVKRCAPGPSETMQLFTTKRECGVELWGNVADDEWSDEITAAVYDYLHETWVGVKVGQWIICGLVGEFYPCDPDVFRQSYEDYDYDKHGGEVKMGFIKHGEGEIVPDEESLKTASTTMTDEDRKALAAENAQADGE